MILTPLFTLPLNTMPRKERLTVQLVGINLDKGNFSFDFSLLNLWIEMAHRCGIEYFEFSHLFTQWGAEYTPKIVVKINGKEEKLFGWHVRSDSKEYTAFLSSFLPALKKHIEKLGITDKVYFHCSDEPEMKHKTVFRKAVGLMKKNLGGIKIFDAMTNEEFYATGLVPIPIPLETMFEKFITLNFNKKT
jgi:hypothetical protein